MEDIEDYSPLESDIDEIIQELEEAQKKLNKCKGTYFKLETILNNKLEEMGNCELLERESQMSHSKSLSTNSKTTSTLSQNKNNYLLQKRIKKLKEYIREVKLSGMSKNRNIFLSELEKKFK